MAKLIAERLALLEHSKTNTEDSKLSLSANPSKESNEKKLVGEELGLTPTSLAIEATSPVDNSEVINHIKKETKIFENNYSNDEQRNTALQNLSQYPPILVAEEWHKNKLKPELIHKVPQGSLYSMDIRSQVAFENWVTQFTKKIYELDNSVILQSKSIIFFPSAPNENLVGSSNIMNRDALTPASENTDGP